MTTKLKSMKKKLTSVDCPFCGWADVHHPDCPDVNMGKPKRLKAILFYSYLIIFFIFTYAFFGLVAWKLGLFRGLKRIFLIINQLI